MMHRFVTAWIGVFVLCCLTAHAGDANELVLYSATIEPTMVQDDDVRGDILSDPKRIRIINLGKVVNHSGLDYAPTVSADGKTLYFVSNRKGSRLTRDNDFSHDFWATKKQNELDTVFIDPFNIDTVDAGVNTVFNEGAVSIAADKQSLYFTGCDRTDGLGDCDIYKSELQGDRWGKPVNLGKNVNSPYWDSQPSISANGLRIYFVSNRPSPTNPDGGGNDDMDIWYSDYDRDMDEWMPAKNLGPDVNTDKMEVAPFMAADGVTLFFSSNGHKPNMGGLDFYMTKKAGQKDREGRDKWAKPAQLPAPINTAEDDQFITIPASGKVLYFSSRRQDIRGFQGDLDVFMAFVPTFTRAVNLIVNVIDECTGQNIPATVQYRNTRTARTQKDEVSTSKVESNIIVGNDDYGTNAANREKTVTFTVTASSPSYGERSINVEVEDPGETVDAAEANVQTEIRKTITLGQRPVLSWEAASSEWARKRNDPFKGLLIQEKAKVELFPLLPYIFFDLGSATLPQRYIKFANASRTAGFDDERIPGGTLDKYYHTLNIYGYRLRKHPTVNVEVRGCVDADNEDKNSALMRDRATTVFNYLKDVWGIAESRMRVTTSKNGWPDTRSNPKDSLGIVENRRVEIYFEGDEEERWQVARPILDNDPILSPMPANMTWNMKNGIDNEIVASRRVEVTWNGKPYRTLTEVGVTDATNVWDWTDAQGAEHPPVPANQQREEGAKVINMAPFEATLIVTSKNGQECKSDPVRVPVRFATSRDRSTTVGEEMTFEKYNLILFPFDKFDPGPFNDRILRDYVNGRVKKSSRVKVEGHTDVVGMFDHNKRLSENRAKAVRTALDKAVRGAYASLDSRGTGEEEPLYKNDLPEERFFNRTVQVIVETPLEDADIAD